jgi:small redox-active disulfide protein 2
MVRMTHPTKFAFLALNQKLNKETKMKNIKVLGTGCANCKTTLKLIEEMAKEKGEEIQLEKVEDIQSIMGYGVMSTPGVVLDGKVVHAGGVPSRDKIAGWL